MKIRAMMPSNVQTMLKRKDSIKKKWRELFNDDTEPEVLELTISPVEKMNIESGDLNNNNVLTYDRNQVEKEGRCDEAK